MIDGVTTRPLAALLVAVAHAAVNAGQCSAAVRSADYDTSWLAHADKASAWEVLALPPGHERAFDHSWGRSAAQLGSDVEGVLLHSFGPRVGGAGPFDRRDSVLSWDGLRWRQLPLLDTAGDEIPPLGFLKFVDAREGMAGAFYGPDRGFWSDSGNSGSPAVDEAIEHGLRYYQATSDGWESVWEIRSDLLCTPVGSWHVPVLPTWTAVALHCVDSETDNWSWAGLPVIVARPPGRDFGELQFPAPSSDPYYSGVGHTPALAELDGRLHAVAVNRQSGSLLVDNCVHDCVYAPDGGVVPECTTVICLPETQSRFASVGHDFVVAAAPVVLDGAMWYLLHLQAFGVALLPPTGHACSPWALSSDEILAASPTDFHSDWFWFDRVAAAAVNGQIYLSVASGESGAGVYPERPDSGWWSGFARFDPGTCTSEWVVADLGSDQGPSWQHTDLALDRLMSDDAGFLYTIVMKRAIGLEFGYDEPDGWVLRKVHPALN